MLFFVVKSLRKRKRVVKDMLLERVRQTIMQYDMCPQNTKIVIGLSGGADSVALVHILWRLHKQYHWQLETVHIHHGLRGKEADADAAFAKVYSESLQIPCTVVCFDAAKMAKEQKCTVEEAGRNFRYEIFAKQAEQTGRIAVAHHADDQAETILMRLCRGTGLEGLTGMLPIRKNIIRPLLFCSRKEIEQYCQQHRLCYQQDSTNFETAYTRNKIRLQVIPLLEQVHGGSAAHLAKTANLLAEENDFMTQTAKQMYQKIRMEQKAVCLQKEMLQNLHKALRRRVLRLAVEEAVGSTKNLTQAHLEAMELLVMQNQNGFVQIVGGWQFCAEYQKVWFRKEQILQTQYQYDLHFETKMDIKEAGVLVECGILTEKNEEFYHNDCTKLFDYDKIKKSLCVRNRRAGDLIRLRGGTKKLKALFIDEKIPKAKRDTIPLLACGEEILWIYGGQTSVAFAADETTKKYMWVRITEGKNHERKN